MDRQNVIGMICGYYLSRFDRDAYRRLGYGSQQATHEALAAKLHVPADSIKNWRDEFDPIHDNDRQGWHKRAMYPSRRRTAEALAEVDEEALFGLVQTVLGAPNGKDVDLLIAAVAAPDDQQDPLGQAFSPRGPTGAAAERYFAEFHAATGIPIAGKLIPRRDDAVGFDFEIRSNSGLVAVEVKGMANESGGVTLTEKEWATAIRMGDAYFLAIVRNLDTKPEISFIRGPARLLQPQQRVYTVVRTEWCVTNRALRDAETH